MQDVKDFLNYSYDVLDEGIATEADMRYKAMRLMQTNVIALSKQLHDQRNICEKKLKEANSIDELESFSAWLDKQEAGIQRKINGKEIKNKNALQKCITMYHEYKSKINAKSKYPESDSFAHSTLSMSPMVNGKMPIAEIRNIHFMSVRMEYFEINLPKHTR